LQAAREDGGTKKTSLNFWRCSAIVQVFRGDRMAMLEKVRGMYERYNEEKRTKGSKEAA
jgi:hypothetical protein